MNGWQIARQLAYLLSLATWPETSGEVVFGASKVSVSPLESQLSRLRFPFVLVAPGTMTADPEDPRLVEQEFLVRLAVRVASDPWGEHALIGGPRSSGVKSSDGRGLMEVEEELLRAVEDLDRTDGVTIQVVSQSAIGAVEDEELGYVVTREYVLRAWTTTTRSYAAPLRFSAQNAGGGSANLSWQIPADRFDYASLVMRRAAGSTPPTTVTDGTDVPVASKTTTSLTDSPGAGTWSYSLFAGYDEDGDGVSDRFSAPVSATVVVV